MTSKTSSLPGILVCVAAIVIFSAAPRAVAIPVTFSGGSGTPLSFSLANPVSYTITTAAPIMYFVAPVFVFKNTGAPYFSGLIASTSTMRFSVNGGPAQVISFAGANNTAGTFPPNDLIFSGPHVALNVGDVVTLSAGILTSFDNVAGAAPANGSYSTFIYDLTGKLLSTEGVSGAPAPESLSTLWLALPVVGMVALRRLHRSGV
jgi:hypothetical protein